MKEVLSFIHEPLILINEIVSFMKEVLSFIDESLTLINEIVSFIREFLILNLLHQSG